MSLNLSDLLGDLSAADLTALVTDHAPIEDEEQPELLVVSHRIAGQFVEVIAVAAGQLLAGHPPELPLQQLSSALDSLRRLAESAEDAGNVALVAELAAEIAEFEGKPDHARARLRFADRLREWLPRYGDHLGGESQRRLAGLVEFDADAVPLFDELHRIRGIGKKRLARLYSAGLFSAETVAGATPADIAAVTGLPLSLAEAVVARTHEWVEERRRAAVVEMRRRISEFKRVLDSLPSGAAADLRRAAVGAIEEMKLVIQDFDKGGVR